MLCASLILLAGCKQKSGLEILNSRMTGLKALKSQYVVKHKGEKDMVIDFIFSNHSRVLATSSDFAIGTNEIDGRFESYFPDRNYDSLPWDLAAPPGTGKLVNAEYITGGPVCGTAPNDLIKSIPWKLEGKSGSIERYWKVAQSKDGPLTFRLEVDERGMPVKFEAPHDMIYVTKSFEIVDDIPLAKFRVEPKDGFVSKRVPTDQISLQTGEKFDYSKFKKAPDTTGFRLEGKTLFAIVDPNEPSSNNSLSWINQASPQYKKVRISIGKANSGFFDPTGDLVRRITTSTPMFILVDKDSTILGLWLGFDPETYKEFEADILKAIG